MTAVVEPFGAERKPLIVAGSKGAPKNVLTNVVEYLGYHQAWRGVIRWDEFRNVVMVSKRPPRDEGRLGAGEWQPCEWRDDHTALASAWLCAKSVDVGESTIGFAAGTVARWEWNRFHPVREWLDANPWKGEFLADDWLVRFAGCEDNAAVRMAGRMWLVSSIARIMQPGAQVDHMIVLEGKQGAGKTSLARALCGSPDWFSATPLQLQHGKDAYMQVQGVQVYLLDEFDKLMAGHSASVIKDFVTQTSDRFRVPYGKALQTFHRQCVFVASTNEVSYFDDPTGNRRYWPVRCGRAGPLRPAELAEHRAQLWAHAREIQRSKEIWWPTPEQSAVLATEQGRREIDDTWAELVIAWVEAEHPTIPNFNADTITTQQILQGALKLDPKDQSKAASARVGRILRKHNWNNEERDGTGDRPRFWRKNDAAS